MNVQEYDADDPLKVWLSSDEVDALLAATDETVHRIALGLGARCGLCSAEVVEGEDNSPVMSTDVVDTQPLFESVVDILEKDVENCHHREVESTSVGVDCLTFGMESVLHLAY